jgi:hypothetical protein
MKEFLGNPQEMWFDTKRLPGRKACHCLKTNSGQTTLPSAPLYQYLQERKKIATVNTA